MGHRQDADLTNDRELTRPGFNLAQRLLAGTAWAFVLRAVGMVSTLAVNAFLARMLTPEEMGAYFLAVSIAGFAAVIARFGLKQTVVRLVAESMAKGLPGRAGKTLRIVYGVSMIGVLLVSGILYFGVGAWLAQEVFRIPLLATVTGLLALWVAVGAFQTPVAETFRGLHDIRLATWFSGAFASLLLAASLAVVWFLGRGMTFERTLILSVVTGAVSLGLGAVLLARRAGDLRGAGDISAGEVLRISGPLFVTNLAVQAYTSFSLWVVGAYLPAAEVAVYGAAWKLINLVALPLQLVGMAVEPFIAELNAVKDKQRLQNALRGTATLAALPAAGVLLAYMFFGGELLGLVYGDHYRQGALILFILSVGQLFKVWTGSSGQVLSYTGHQRQLMSVTLATGLVGIVLTLWAVQFWGLVGVAVATSAARVIQNMSEWILVRRLTGLWTHAAASPGFLREAARRALARQGG